MSEGQSTSLIVQQLDLLIGGYGYNCYRSENQMRADDQLVRQRASQALAEAARLLSGLHVAYQQRFIPTATRENPLPPAGELQRAREITRLRERIEALDAQVRGMSVPTQDRFWQRYRTEAGLLNQLIDFDYRLITLSAEVEQRVRALTPDGWKSGEGAALDEPLRGIEATVRERSRLLLST